MTARWLGQDFAAGRKAKTTTHAGRMARSAHRWLKVRQLRRQGIKVASVVTQGFFPAAGFAGACLGIKPRDLQALTGQFVQTLPGKCTPRAAILQQNLGKGMAIGRLVAAPLRQWARASWRQQEHTRSLQFAAWRRQARDQASDRDQWRHVVGPVGAIACTIRRMGWTWPAPQTLRTAQGELIDMTKTSPAEVEHRAADAFQRHQLTLWTARSSGKQQLGTGPLLEPLGQLLRSKKKGWTQAHRATLRYIVTGSYMTQHQLYEAGMADSLCCPLCGRDRQGHAHLYFECIAPCVAAARARVFDDHEWLREVHEKGAEELRRCQATGTTSHRALLWDRAWLKDPSLEWAMQIGSEQEKYFGDHDLIMLVQGRAATYDSVKHASHTPI